MKHVIQIIATAAIIVAAGCESGPDCTTVCNDFTQCGPQSTMYDKCIMRCLNGFFEDACLECSDFGSETDGACTELRTCFYNNCFAWDVGIPAIDPAIQAQACANPPPDGTPNADMQDCGIWRELISMCKGDDAMAAGGEAECKKSYNSPECTACLDLKDCTDLLACNVLNCRWTIMAGCTFE